MVMQLDPASTQGKRLAANIYRAAVRMRELLADLAGVSCGNKSTCEICEIRAVIIAASETALLAAESQGFEIVHEVPEGLEIPVQRSRIERVFFNLITNALEAMPQGGQIRIGARKAENIVLIDVADTGPGIPRAIRDRLFEPFVTAGKDHGLGLGLALHQAERADLAHLHPGAVVLQAVLQLLLDGPVVLRLVHVDEVDDDQAGQVAQAQL